MTYRLAIIQNESEMFRYSYADARHLLAESQYDWSYYTAENIDTLGANLDRYDALIVSTNACNDERIASWFEANRDTMSQYLNGLQRGLFVLFQMALSDPRGRSRPFPFLPENLAVTGRYRFLHGEQASDGQLRAAPGSDRHPILIFPHSIDTATMQHRCVHNNNAPGLYWGYLGDFSDESYEIILADTQPDSPRPLLVAARQPLGPRIIITSLVIDWQRHDELWHNCVRYIVEGANPVAIVRPRGSESFNLDYLEHALRERKQSFYSVSVDRLADWEDRDRLFPSVVLDPHWDVERSRDFATRLTASGAATMAPSVHYFDRLAADVMVSCTVSRQDDYRTIVDSAIAWLRAQWNGEGYWQNSFWASYDVLDLLVARGENVSVYGDSILGAVAGNIQPNGTYNDVFGATCATLQVYQWFGVEDDRFDKALHWIQHNLAAQNQYNRATALELLHRTAPGAITREDSQQIIDGILRSKGKWDVGLETLRYMRTLVALGYYDAAQTEARRLQPAAHGDPEWLSVFGAAETVCILLDIYSNATSPTSEVERMLFGGVEYLLDEYDHSAGAWRGSVAPTAKAARALNEFSKQAAPAISETIAAVTRAGYAQVSTRSLDQLQKRNTALNVLIAREREGRLKTESLAREGAAKARLPQNLSIVFLWMAYGAVIAAATSITIVIESAPALVMQVKDWQQATVPIALALALWPFAVTLALLQWYGREPRWLRVVLSLVPFLRGALGETDRRGSANR